MADQYDITVKDLFADAESRQDLVRFFTGTGSRLTGDLSVEFAKVEKKISDLLLLAEDEAGPLAIHLEFQSFNDPEMGPRMLRYAAEILRKYRMRINQTVVYFGDDELGMVDGLCYHIDDDNRLDFRYRIVDLGHKTSEEINSQPNQHLRAFLPLVDRKRRKMEKEKFLEACVQDIMATDLPLEDKKVLLIRAELFSGLVFTKDIIDLVFKGVEIMLNLQESAGYRRIYEKGEIKGKREGKREGRREGRREGKGEAAQEFLARRFGEQSADIQKKVKEITDLDILDSLLPELFSADTLEEARRIVREGLARALQAKKDAKK